MPALAAAAPRDAASTGAEIQNQANFCEGTYALCIKAPCSGIPTLDRLGNYVIDRALCACDVVEGVSMGPGSCEDREPVTQQGRKYLISTYSNRYNDTNRTLTCENPKTVWAWCYGAPCVVDEKDPGKATCTCPVMQSPMSTLGGNCRQDACEGIWSARCRRATSSRTSTSIARCSRSIRTCGSIRRRRRVCGRAGNRVSEPVEMKR